MKLKKALGDLKSNIGRTATVILALVIGLWGVGLIVVSGVILSNDLNANYLKTMPLHTALTSNDFEKLNLIEFKKRAEIESAEFRDLSFQRIEISPNEWIPFWIFAVDDFSNLKLAKVFNQSGKAPGAGDLLMERDAMKFSNLNIGSKVKVRANQNNITMKISGIAFDPGQAPATQDHVIYGYVNKKTYSSITGEPSNHRLILRFKSVKNTKQVKTLTSEIVKYFNSIGIGINSIDTPNLNEHPHQWQLNSLLFLNASIGFLAFFMAAVLVSQLMSAILAKQIRQIGILKSIGASKRAIYQIYIVMVLVFGVIAGIIAIPLAVWSGYGFSYFVANTLNFEILTKTLPPQIYLYLSLASLFIPLALSLPAIRRGINISAKDALSNYGIQSTFSAKRKERKFPLPSSLVLALRNTMRQKKRLIVTVIAMALGVAIFSTGFNIERSLQLILGSADFNMGQDVSVVYKNQIPKEVALAPFKNLKNVGRVDTWSGGFGGIQSKLIATSEGIGFVALPYNTDLYKMEMEKGRWLRKSKKPEIVLNQKASELFGDPEVGKDMMLNFKDKPPLKVKLAGIGREFAKPKIYIDREQYDKFANPDHLVNNVLFVAKDRSYDKVMALKKDIEKAITPTKLNVVYVISQKERVKVIYDHLKIVIATVVFLAMIVLVVSALGMASATGINIMERTREIGILRAIGATPRQIYKLFVTEGMLVSIASIALGFLLSWPLSIYAAKLFGNVMLGDGLEMKFAFSFSGFWITLIATLIFGWLASRIPAQNAVKLSTREALSYE